MATRVETAIDDGASMSWINACEVYYITVRKAGEHVAMRAVDGLRAQVRLDAPTPETILAAASIKARHRMSYADAFACATAVAHDATLLTGDDEILQADGPWRVEDIRGG